ncbi:MAG: RNA methyltransferase [Pseudomonadota bacterium]
MLDRIRVVLSHTSHPGNIGAVARAMKTMGLTRLYLVQPKLFPHAEATARASGADDVLAAAQVCASLAEATQECVLVLGASARTRSLPCPVLSPAECARRACAESAHSEVAVVFGCEQSGLSNAEIDRCQYLVRIPTNPDFASLNLAAAVQIIAYEILVAQGPAAADAPEQLPVSAGEMERFYTHLEETLLELAFLDPDNPRQLMRRLRRLYSRVRPDENEINILRGILAAAQQAVRRGR